MIWSTGPVSRVVASSESSVSATSGCLPAQREDLGLQAPHRGEVERVPARLERGGELVREGERLLVLARLDEGLDRVAP